MNHWYTVGLIATDHRADLAREAEETARMKLAEYAAERALDTWIPHTARPRRWPARLGALIRTRLGSARPASES
jgi:hypothetical protein